MALDVRGVDPRDVTVEVDHPTFRVHFWRGVSELRCREYEVTGGDVDDVIQWAEHVKDDDETYVVGVLATFVGAHGNDVMLTRIKGTDPTGSGDHGPDAPRQTER